VLVVRVNEPSAFLKVSLKAVVSFETSTLVEATKPFTFDGFIGWFPGGGVAVDGGAVVDATGALDPSAVDGELVGLPAALFGAAVWGAAADVVTVAGCSAFGAAVVVGEDPSDDTDVVELGVAEAAVRSMFMLNMPSSSERLPASTHPVLLAARPRE